MDDRTHTHLVEQLAGDGWLLSGGVRLGQVTYAIDIHEIRTSLGAGAVSGAEARVRLLNHSSTAAQVRGQPVTLKLHDGRRQITGFLSEDDARLIR